MSMENGGLSASDVAMLSNNGLNDGNSFMWIFALLILANGGFGFGNNNYRPQYATQDFVQNGFNFNDLQDQNRDLMAAITAGTAQSVAASNQIFHDTVNFLGDKYSELARDIAALAVSQQQIMANQNACCCETKQLIAEAKYDTAMQLANFESRLNQKLDANTIQGLRDQLDDVKDQLNMSGVLRFPNQWSYGAGQFPPIFGGCPGQQNI